MGHPILTLPSEYSIQTHTTTSSQTQTHTQTQTQTNPDLNPPPTLRLHRPSRLHLLLLLPERSLSRALDQQVRPAA